MKTKSAIRSTLPTTGFHETHTKGLNNRGKKEANTILTMGGNIMKKIDISSWPVLLVSDQIQLQNDEGAWLREVVKDLTEQQNCSVMLSYAYSDAHDIVHAREDLGTIVIDWDLTEVGRWRKKNEHLKLQIEQKNSANVLVDFVRERNATIPVLLLTDRGSIEDIPSSVLSKINGVIWKLTDTSQFLAGRIERHVKEYTDAVLPPFFGELVNYVNEYKYAWHTPGHMGGEGFLRSPSGTAFHKFFGEDVLRADLSISVPELGSLLDHSGVTGEAEKFSAKVFGATLTYYVLNGTSTANQIIWRSQISPGEKSLVDRNCHKSLNYAMVITSAKPEYMQPMRNGLGIIGPVDFRKICKEKQYKMSALTNSTYDGVCYNTNYVKECLENVDTMHFDEAWYAYAKFHPLYKGHFGMSLPADKLVFCSQSTHKLLTAFSQASMIHVKLPKDTKKAEFHTLFNESYMMHGSTSPQYTMIASLEVASKMMHDNGETAFHDIIEEAIELRKKIAIIQIQKTSEEKKDWFFGMWQPDYITEVPTEKLIKKQKHWIIKPSDAWHGFDVKDEYVMLDPIKLTFTCPGIDVNGKWSETGIPASIVTNFLISRGIVCEKSDYYSWLMLNSLGTTKGKQGTLVAELFRFKELYDSNADLEEVFPALVFTYPEKYKNMGLKDHCQDMHRYIRKKHLLCKMNRAFEVIPDQKFIPADAYRHVVKKNVELVKLNDIDPEKKRVAAVMLVPYPPGIPIMIGGEKLNCKAKPILEYLIKRQKFENKFPGYESDIHGIERTEPDGEGKKYFKTLLIK